MTQTFSSGRDGKPAQIDAMDDFDRMFLEQFAKDSAPIITKPTPVAPQAAPVLKRPQDAFAELERLALRENELSRGKAFEPAAPTAPAPRANVQPTSYSANYSRVPSAPKAPAQTNFSMPKAEDFLPPQQYSDTPSYAPAPKPAQAAPVAEPATAQYSDSSLKAFEEELRRFQQSEMNFNTAHMQPTAPVVPRAKTYQPEIDLDQLRNELESGKNIYAENYHAQPKSQSGDYASDFNADLNTALLPEPPEKKSRFSMPKLFKKKAAPLPEEVQAYPELPPLEYVYSEAEFPTEQEVKPRSRKTIYALGGAAFIAMVGVYGAFGFGNNKSIATNKKGEAPTIVAKTGPVKEKPLNPGGIEIPDQNKQVLAKNAEEPKVGTVVNNAEEPVDLNQLAKKEQARVIAMNNANANAVQPAPQAQVSQSTTSLSAPPFIVNNGVQPSANAAPANIGTTNTAIGSSKAAQAPLAEPRKVRAIKITPENEVSAQSTAQPTRIARVEPTPEVKQKTQTPSVVKETTATPTTKNTARLKKQAKPAEDEEDDTPAANAPMKITGNDSGTSSKSTKVATASRQATSAGNGSYAVQLGFRNSEGEAKSELSRLQSKYSDVIGDQSASVRKAEVADKGTIYRIRVGGLSKESANELCSRLKSSGGNCFVAGN